MSAAGSADRTPAPVPLRNYTRAEVEREGSTSDKVLIVIEDGVYDVSEFRKIHPGGVDVLTALMGRDATGAFAAVGHSTRAHSMMEKYKVGLLSSSRK